jgi:hypothetical protein
MPSLTPPVIISRGVTRHDRFIRREPRQPELHQQQWRNRRYHKAPLCDRSSCIGSDHHRRVIWRATRHDGHWLGQRRARVACVGRGEDSDAVPPDVRNGPQERLGARAGVNLGGLAREREVAAPRVARGNLSGTWTCGRAYVMLSPAIDDVICGQPCDGCCNRALENVIASRDWAADGAGVVSMPE